MSSESHSIILQYCQSKDPALKEKILLSYKPLVDYIARKLSFNREDLEDLAQVGSIGLLRALDRFDPGMQTDFSTFATPNIIGEIKHYFRDKRNIVKIPRKLQETHTKVKNFLKEAQQNTKSPTTKDIASALGISEEEVLEALEAGQTVNIVSLDMPSYSKNEMRGSGGSDSLVDILGDDSSDDLYLDKATLKEAISQLDEREQRIVYLRYYRGLSQREISEITQLSQMHISRLLTGILKKLRKSIDS